MRDRYIDDDEIVVSDCSVHLERMDSDSIWIGITKGGHTVHVNLWAKGKLSMRIEEKPNPARTRG